MPAILAVSLVLRLAFLNEPFERDEGAYAYIGAEILRGAVPYRDVIDMKPPGIYYLYALGIAIFGETTQAIRIFTALYSLLTVYAVFLVTRLISGPTAGLIAALLHGIFSSAPLLQGSSSNTEVFLVLPALLIIYFLLQSVEFNHRRNLFFCGIACAASILIKTVAMPFVLLAALSTIARPRSINTGREKMLDISALATGPVMLGSITLAYFFLNGALEDFIYWNMTFPLRYFSSSVGGPLFASTAVMLLPTLLPLIVIAIPAFFGIICKSRTWKEYVAALTLPAALTAVILPGKHFPHYFILLVPPLAILTAMGIARFWTMQRRQVVCWAAIFVFSLLVSLSAQFKYYLIYTPYEVSMEKYGPVFVESLDVARYLKERTSPSDYIFQWGFQMELYYLSSRRSPVPFISSTLVTGPRNSADSIQQLLAGINQKKPKYIVFEKKWGDLPGSKEMAEIISRDYFLEATVAYAEIHRRKSNNTR